MLDKTTAIDRAVIEKYLTLLIGSPDTEMEWRFLPERGTAEEKRILQIEKAERQRLKAGGDSVEEIRRQTELHRYPL
jgi:hypothetical protein